MGTTSEKLQYLATTKTLLKNKINLTGANITTDTFRSYPTKLQNALLNCWNNEGEPIFTNWGTKVNGEGTNVKLDNTINARMKITPKGNTSQTGTPTPSSPIPVNVVSGDNEVVVCGKNLLPENDYANGWTASGITYTKNADGTFNFVGTATGNVTFNLLPDILDIFEPNTSYYLYSSYPYNANSYNISIRLTDNNNNSTFLTPSSVRTSPATIQAARFSVYFVSGTTVNVQNAKAMLVKSNSIDTTYEPYTSQNYPLYLGVENLITYSVRNGNALYFNGSTQNVYPFKAGTYTLSYEDTNSCFLYYKTANVSSTSLGSNKVTTFTINEDFNIWLYRNGMVDNEVSEIQLTKGSTPQHISDNPIELCKIGTYQDYIYKDSGKWYLHKEIGKVVLNGSENWNNDGGTQGTDYRHNIYYAGRMSIPIAKGTNGTYLSNYFAPRNVSSDSGELGTFYMSNSWLVFVDKNKTYDLDQWKTWLSTNQPIIYYVLATATDTEITNTTLINQLEALKGATSYEGQTNINGGFMIVGASALGELE